jgi:hypothetical protein
MQALAKATSGIPPAKNRALKGGGNRNCECAGGKAGLVGFRRLHMHRAAGSERVRGRTPNIAPWPNPIRSERGISPAHFAHAPDRHRQRPRLQAWSAQRIEQAAEGSA